MDAVLKGKLHLPPGVDAGINPAVSHLRIGWEYVIVDHQLRIGKIPRQRCLLRAVDTHGDSDSGLRQLIQGGNGLLLLLCTPCQKQHQHASLKHKRNYGYKSFVHYVLLDHTLSSVYVLLLLYSKNIGEAGYLKYLFDLLRAVFHNHAALLIHDLLGREKHTQTCG